MNTNSLLNIPQLGRIESLDALDSMFKFGVGYVPKGVLENEGHLFCFKASGIISIDCAVQVFITYTGSTRLIRTYNWSSKTWTDWSAL